MSNKIMKEKVIEFIIANGWVRDGKEDYYETYIKENNIAFDIDGDEIVVLSDIGDIAHFNINVNIIYTLLGYLLHNRNIAIDYKWVE
jgi:hypothetical protein